MAHPRAARPPFTPWDRRELPGAFSVEETARRVGNYKWVESRLFEALGGWVATVPELDVKLKLGTHCYKHAWHAELWHKRLPELREMNPDRLTIPANDGVVAFLEAVTEPEAPEQTIEKLVGVYRVLIPRKIAAYTFHLHNTSTITDAPTIRSLKFALGDEFDDWREGEMLLQSLIETPEDAQRAADHQARLEGLITAAGGIAGEGTLGPLPGVAGVSGPRVIVEPATFTLVDFDAAHVAALVSEAGSWVGLTEADEVRFRVDERSPLARAEIESMDPIVLSLDGGALEDQKKIRQLDPQGVQITAVRLLARVADRRRPDFGDAPSEADVSVPELDCWDAWTLGRAARRGLGVASDRWRYRFRNRHGFTDVADAVFDRLWGTDDLTWADLAAACSETAAR